MHDHHLTRDSGLFPRQVRSPADTLPPSAASANKATTAGESALGESVPAGAARRFRRHHPCRKASHRRLRQCPRLATRTNRRSDNRRCGHPRPARFKRKPSRPAAASAPRSGAVAAELDSRSWSFDCRRVPPRISYRSPLRTSSTRPRSRSTDSPARSNSSCFSANLWSTERSMASSLRRISTTSRVNFRRVTGTDCRKFSLMSLTFLRSVRCARKPEKAVRNLGRRLSATPYLTNRPIKGVWASLFAIFFNRARIA